MIAIGAQCRGQPGDPSKAFRYFSQARKLSFQGFLTDLTLNTARAFVLMAFYMFGACRRNAAFMYLGVATKAASVLGLHMSQHFQSLPGDEKRLRSRIDRSIRLFDVTCSSILGRPTSSLPCGHQTLDESDDGDLTSHRSESVSAAGRFSSILNRIVDKLTNDGGLGVGASEAFLKEIRLWSTNLPNELRRGLQHSTSSISQPSLDRETAIGNMHVACSYYFGVITTTREFLIQHIMPQLDNEAIPIGMTRAAPEDRKVAELSTVCVDAAAYMAEMCSEALDSGVIMGNMCILKAWLFAAGLILGFSLLDVNSGLSNRTAFRSTLRVLEFLGRLSPQAAQYHRVLKSFSQALDTYKSRSTQDSYRSTAPYVERLLSLNSVGSPERTRRQLSTGHVEGGGDTYAAGQTPSNNHSVSVNPFDFSLALGPLDLGGEDLILSLLWEGEGGVNSALDSLDRFVGKS